MTRRTLALIAIVGLSSAAPRALAQPAAGYPFEGEITADDVNVRSGEGTRYYATTKLRTGDRVLVLGESSGWYKILPPAGSFSYIDQAAVERRNANIGSVSRDRAYVRAGSDISRRKSRTQVILNRGDPVVILGEADGFYKIEPPAGAAVYVTTEYVRRIAAGQESGLVKRYNAADWTKPGGDADVDDGIDHSDDSPIEITPAPTRTETEALPPPTAAKQPTTNSPARVEPTPVVSTKTSSPVKRETQGDTLVLTANGSNAPRTTTAPPAPRTTTTPPPAKTITVSTEHTTTTETTTTERRDLTPADRRPPAQMPDWAQDGEAGESSKTRIASTETKSTTTAAPAPKYLDGASTRTSGPSSYRAANPPIVANATPPVTARSTTSTTMGTMTEITPGYGETSPRPTNTPAIAANSYSHQTSTATPPAPVEQPHSDTLVLNAGTPSRTTTPSMPGNDLVETAHTETETETNTVIASSTPEASVPFEAPPVPIDPNAGPYAARLVEIENDLFAAMSLPVAHRPYDQLIGRYEEVALQDAERVPAEYATIRIEQLKALERVRKLAVRYASDHDGIEKFSRRMDEERREIRTAGAAQPSTGVFEYEGTLMRSYAFAPEKRRFRLIDPGTQSTIIYVDIPVEVMPNPDIATGKHVGIRIGSRQYSDAARIPIVEAAAVIDLSAPPTKFTPLPESSARNSG